MRRDVLPVAGIVLGGALWGLIWMPLRWLGEAGLPGAWAGTAIFVFTVALLVPVAFRNRHRMARNATALLLCGAFTGMAFSLYATSILLTEVVRAILLFYLTPVWGTALGIAYLGERLTWTRTLAMLSGFAGLVVVLGGPGNLPLPRNTGDWLALTSGMAWAVGTLNLYRMRQIPAMDQMLAFAGGSLAVSLATLGLGGAVLGISAIGGMPDTGAAVRAAPFAFLTALYVLPMLYLTIWPATVLSPGRIGILLMGDVVVSVATAAAFAGEPFGWREGIGTVLVIGAGVIETLGRPGPGHANA